MEICPKKNQGAFLRISILSLYVCNDLIPGRKVKNCVSNWGYFQLNSSCLWESEWDRMQNGKKCPGELGKYLELCVTTEELNRKTYRVEESYSLDRRVVVK